MKGGVDIAQVFPDCCEDEPRMRVLYAEFRSRSLNPLGWDEKVGVWKQAIDEWCRESKRLRFTRSELYNAFEWKGNFPQCLGTVLEEMKREQGLTTTDEFQSQMDNKGWIAWGLNTFVKQPISWSWSVVRNSILGPSTTSSHEYINTNQLKDMGLKVLQRLQDKEDSPTITCSSFHSECQDICPNKDDFQYVLHQLEHNGKLAVFIQDGQKLIKVKSKRNSPVSLTEADIGVVRLQKARETVEKEIEKLKKEVDRCRQEAVVAVKSGFKLKAQNVLGKKKRMEVQLDKKLATLDNIEKMMEQILQTDSQKEVMQAYRSGVDALKSTVKNELNIDKIDDTMADLEDTLEAHAEIQAALNRSVGVVSDPDLEAELDELLREDDDKEDELARNLGTVDLNKSVEIQWPKVPDNSPAKNEETFAVVH